MSSLQNQSKTRGSKRQRSRCGHSRCELSPGTVCTSPPWPSCRHPSSSGQPSARPASGLRGHRGSGAFISAITVQCMLQGIVVVSNRLGTYRFECCQAAGPPATLSSSGFHPEPRSAEPWGNTCSLVTSMFDQHRQQTFTQHVNCASHLHVRIKFPLQIGLKSKNIHFKLEKLNNQITIITYCLRFNDQNVLRNGPEDLPSIVGYYFETRL